MMHPAEQQHALLALIKKRPLELNPSDEYLQRVAASEQLGLLREIALWWRALGIERNCPFTAGLLKRIGRFELAVEAFFCRQATSPYMEEMAIQFLEVVGADSDALVRAVAGFELAMLRVAQGDARTFVIEWDRDPSAALTSIRSGDPLPDPGGCHQITISLR
jgi:hypothetical protein